MGLSAIQVLRVKKNGQQCFRLHIYADARAAKGTVWEEYQMERGSVFMTKRTQSISLPNSMRLPDGVTSVDIVRRGRTWIIVPSNENWAEWFEGETVSDDFTAE